MKFMRNLLLFLTFALPLAAAAQDVTQSVDLGDGYTIAVPADWDVTKLHDGAFTLSSDTITLSVTTATRLSAIDTNFPANTNVVDVLVALAFPFEGADLAPESVQKTRFDNRPAAVYINSTDDTIDKLYAAVTLSDGTFGYLSFSGAKDDFAAFSGQIDDIIASFDSDSVVTPNTVVANAVCTVTIDTANTAQLRVGPGTNRGAISFLPANADVTVTGRIELDDGGIWFQLDKSEAAPNGTPAAELWVNAEDVITSGDCEHVGETAAPPVIPNTVVQPPPAQSGENPSENSPAPSPGALPAAGGWILVLNPVLNASCQGGDNYTFNTDDYFTPTTYGDTVVIRDAGSFYYGGEVFTRIAGTNSFTGSFTYADGSVAPVRFNLVSASQMTGSVTLNYDIEGTPCSETASFVSNRG